MYVAVKGGETAVKNSRKLLARTRRGPVNIPEIQTEQIENQLGLAVDRVMAEGSLYDIKAAVQAIKQAQGDLVEAIFLVRAFRTTLKRYGNSKPVNTEAMRVIRRVSGAFKDIPGGQILGPTYDYTHRLIEFENQIDTPDSDLDAVPNPTPDDQQTAKNTDHFPWVTDILKKQGLMDNGPGELIGETVEDLTRQPLKLPAGRSIRLQSLARGDEGFLLGSAYSLQRGFGLDRHPFLGELRIGYVDVTVIPPELGFEIKIGEIKITECFMINRFNGSKQSIPGFENGYGLVFGQNERKAMSISLLDRSLQNAQRDKEVKYPAQDQEFILSHSDNVESSGFVQHLKLPHYVDFQSELVSIRSLRKTHQQTKRKQTVDARI
ncbi:MAG: carbon-phosphorus lyase complex subunit PhnI [Pseudomonadota bacterium]